MVNFKNNYLCSRYLCLWMGEMSFERVADQDSYIFSVCINNFGSLNVFASAVTYLTRLFVSWLDSHIYKSEGKGISSLLWLSTASSNALNIYYLFPGEPPTGFDFWCKYTDLFLMPQMPMLQYVNG